MRGRLARGRRPDKRQLLHRLELLVTRCEQAASTLIVFAVAVACAVAGGLFPSGNPGVSAAVDRCWVSSLTIVGTDGPDLIRGTPGDDVIHGLTGNDRIWGLGGRDTICGGGGHDVIFGGEGNDFLLGGYGDDLLYGQGSVEFGDRLFGGAGDDLLHGGKGVDYADFDLNACGVDADLQAGTAEGGVSGSDSLISIENLVGSGCDDTLRGSERANKIEGIEGDDLIYGEDGNDLIEGHWGTTS